MLQLVLGVVLASTAPTVSASPPPVEDVAGWVAVLARTAGESEKEEALDGLRAAAAGESNRPRTRAAVFALARVLEDESLGKPGERLQALKVVAALYSDDPKSTEMLQDLALEQLDMGDSYGAHFTLLRLLDHPGAVDSALAARAAANALAVEDMLSAFKWSDRATVDGLSTEGQRTLWRAKLLAAEALARYADARVAIEKLEALAPEALREDARALAAAARTDAAVGRLDAAAARYEILLNVHTDDAGRATSMLEHGRLLARLTRDAAAVRVFDWMVEQYPNSTEADIARIEKIEIQSAALPSMRALAYRVAATEARSRAGADEACKLLLEHFISEGQPLEAISTLGWMARTTTGNAALAARTQLTRGLRPALNNLVSREDDVGLVAVALAAHAIAVPVPQDLVEPVRRARRRLGIPEEDRSSELARMSEALWREGQSEKAMQLLDQALDDVQISAANRQLFVLRADIRFDGGEIETACTDYGSAAGAGTSLWVDHQLSSCARLTGQPAEDSP